MLTIVLFSLVNCFVSFYGFRDIQVLFCFVRPPTFVHQERIYIALYIFCCISWRTEVVRETGQKAERDADRDCERRRKDLESVATVAETNGSVEVENHVTWNCSTHLNFFICYHWGKIMLALGLTTTLIIIN